MYKIGEFSKMCRLPVKTLRFYDSEGLLAPDEIDSFTGYRYYSSARLADCNRIIVLKELGFSLNEIKLHMAASTSEDILALVKTKCAELELQAEQIALRLKKLDMIRQKIEEGDSVMFEIIIKNGESFRIAAKRKIYKNKIDVDTEIKRLSEELPKNICGARRIIINYETEYRESDFDLAACVEITGKPPKNYDCEDKIVTLTGDVAALVCKKSELDEAYSSLTRQLDEGGFQVIGAFYEMYHDDITVELIVPVYRPSKSDFIADDETELTFVNDEEALGKWELLDIVPSAEQFYYGHEKCRHSGWLSELYFLENGEPYWALGGWTRGIVQTVSRHTFNNRYSIKREDGHMLLYLEMKHAYDGGGEKLAMPEIWVYEKVSDAIYHSEDIRRCDFVDYPFVLDKAVLGEWAVKDFYISNIRAFDPAKQNFAKDELFLLKLTFFPDGSCIHLTKQHESVLRWTKGYMLNMKQSLASAYEIRVIDGTEYLITEWKTGDYTFGDGRVYWYIFQRA